MVRIFFIASLLSVFLVSFPGRLVQAQNYPVCQYAASDSDGDGYGWEDRSPCVVTEASSSEALPMQCVDDDGDGWGWDGLQVCRVDVECIDSAPVGDGWGWDGVGSCNIPVYSAPFSELETIKNYSYPGINFGVEIRTATLQCNLNNSVVRYLLRADGRVTTYLNDSREFGYWSTGFSDTDGLIHLYRARGTWIVLTSNSVTLRNRGAAEDFGNCFWE